MKNNTKRVLVTLTPTGRFYFGGDASLATSYIAESNMFPQQTSLLGMLRYLILSNDSEAFNVDTQRIIDAKKATLLIGEMSFQVQENELNFGVIKKIEQCVVQMETGNNNWETLFTPPLDNDFKVEDKTNLVSATINGRQLLIPSAIEGYDPKNPKDPFFVTAKEGKEIKVSDVFTKDVRVGIEKDYQGETKSDAFYKQISYRLGGKESNTQFRFAFYATFDAALFDATLATSKLSGQTVMLGGDSSMFILNIEEKACLDEYPSTGAITCYARRLMLTSDSYLDVTELKFSYALTDTIPFRFLQTSVETSDYNIISKDKLKVKRSSRYELFKRGSVFYFDSEKDCTDFKNKLESQLNFIKIGYNHCQDNIKKTPIND